MPLAILADPWQRVQVREEEVSQRTDEFNFIQNNVKLSVTKLS
jgi:hypothetical protein